MRKRVISFIMATLMLISVFSGYNEILANEKKENFIIHIDVNSILDGYEEALFNEEFQLAMSIADKALDEFEAGINNVKGCKVYDRINLLVPSLFVSATAEAIEKIKLMDHVIGVYKDEPIYISNNVENRMYRSSNIMKPMMIESNDLIGNDSSVQSKYDGRGQVLAVIDGNMDPSHEVFYLSDGVEGKLSYQDIQTRLDGSDGKIKLDANSNAIKADDPWVNKIPFGFNYFTNKAELNPENEKAAHGQHVAGTMGGNHSVVDGQDWHGVAPNAQLLFLNCMYKGQTSAKSYISAAIDAVILGSAAVNYSLGTSKGVPGSVDKLLENLIDTNYLRSTNFVIAAGNEGEYQGFMSIDNPDFGTISNPGIATNAITVASLENKVMYAYGLFNEGNKYEYLTSGDAYFQAGDYEYVFCGKGNPEDFEGVSVDGKVALIYRGGITFNEKVLNAQKKGAVGVIVANNISGLFTMDVKNNKIPAISVSTETGDMLKKANTKKLTISTRLEKFNNPEYGEMSAFTNWGLSAGGLMKPDITAPGGHIFSAQTNVPGTMRNSYGDMSGTSMATPHVSGGVAVVRQYMESNPQFRDITEKAKFTKILLMNSAVPHQDPKTGKLTSPRRQGAGVMNLKKATELDFTVVSKDSGIPSQFVGNVDDKIKIDLVVKNYSNEAKTITPSVAATIEAREGKKLTFRPEDLFSDILSDSQFQVGPGEEKGITLEFPIRNLEKIEPFKNGAFVDGFINFKDQNGMSANFAFVSFKGDYGAIPSVEKPIYEFDFDTEQPMWWNYNFTQKEWFNFATLLLTEKGFDKDGKPIYKIAGLKNFDEINEKKNTPQEPKPEFEPLIFSPNGDGLNDTPSLHLVMTRTAPIYIKILDEKKQIIGGDYIRTQAKNFSYMPEGDRDIEAGYTNIGEIILDSLKDGKYELEVIASPLKGSTGLYEDTYTRFNFTVDTKVPEFIDAKLDESTNTLTFKVKDHSFIRQVNYQVDGGDFVGIEEAEGGIYSVKLPANVDLDKINIQAIDGGYNKGIKTVDQIVNANQYGTVNVNFVKYAPDSVDAEYKIYDASGKEYEVTHPSTTLPIGKYKLEVTKYSDQYKLLSPTIQDFEITAEEKEVNIDISFGWTKRRTLSINVSDISDLSYDDFDIVAVDLELADKVYPFKSHRTMKNMHTIELPYGSYDFKLRLKDPTKGNYRLELEDTTIPFIINDQYQDKQIIIGKVIKSDNKINVIESGLSKLGHDKIKYVASKPGSGEFTSLDKLTAGSYEIIPVNPPAGYYVKDAYPTVTLTEDKPYADVYMDYVKDDGSKISLTVKDNLPANESVNYMIYDYKSYLGMDGGNEYIVASNGTIELAKGRYMVKTPSNENYYGLAIDTGEDYTFVNLEDIAKTVEFKYNEYNGQDPVGQGKIRIEDESLSGDYSYNYILSPKIGRKISHRYESANLDSQNINLPYGSYEIEISNLKDGYTTEPKSFIVSSKNFDQTIKIVKKTSDSMVDVEFKFICDGELVSPVEFTLDGVTMHDGVNKVKAGNYKLSIKDLPVKFEVIKETEDVSIDSQTKELVIQVRKTSQKIRKVYSDIYDNSKLLDNNVVFTAISANGKKYKGKIVPDGSSFRVEYELPYGEYELEVKSLDNRLQPEFTNYGKFTIDGNTKETIYALKTTLYKAFKIDASAIDQNGNKIDLEYKVTKKFGNKTGVYSIDSVPAVRGKECEVEAINLPKGIKVQKNPLITAFYGNYFDGSFNPVKFKVTVDPNMKRYQVTFNYGYADKVEIAEVNEGEKVKEPAKPTRDCYEFKGWYVDQDFSQAYDFDKEVTSKLELFAKWEETQPEPEPTKYKVTFVKNNDSADEVVEVIEGEKVTAPQVKKDGFDLVGWFKDEGLTEEFDFESPIKADTTIYAKWEKYEDGLIKVSVDGYDKTGMLNNNVEIYAIDSKGVKHIGKIIQNGRNFKVEFELPRGDYELKARSLDGIVMPEYESYGNFIVKSDSKKVGPKIYLWKAFNVDVSAEDQNGDKVELEYKVVRKSGDMHGEYNIDKVPAVRDNNYEVYVVNIPEGIKVEKNPLKTSFDGPTFIQGAFEPVKFKITVDSSAKIHQVKFVKSNGLADEIKKVPDGLKVIAPEVQKKGYKFLGWFTDANFTKEFDFESPIKENITLYAKWHELEKPRVTVIIPIQDKSRNFNYKNAEVCVVDKDGKEYIGTVTKGKYTNYYNAEFKLEKGRYEIKARSLDEDSLLPDYQRYGKFNVYSSPITFKSTQAVFFRKPTKIDVSAVDQDEESVDLEYIVIRQKGEKYGEFPIDKVPAAAGYESEVKAINIPEGMKVVKNPIKTTYYNSESSYTPVKFNVIVDKQPKAFKVTFVNNNESENTIVEVKEGEKVTKPENLEKEGYNFVGWFTDEELTTEFNFDTEIKADTILYAKWQPKEYTVTFKFNNEAADMEEKVTYGKKVEKPSDPEKEGYDFVGWFTDEDLNEVFDFETPIKSDISLYAKWEEIVLDPTAFKVTFVKNNETDNEIVEVKEGEKVTKPENPEKEGYRFVGWFTDEKLTTEFNFDTEIKADTILYAKWEKIIVEPTSFTVTFDPANGEAEWKVEVVDGNAIGRPGKDPEKKNYTFLGWQLDGVDYDFSAKVIKDIKLIAAYKENTIAPEPTPEPEPKPEPRPYNPGYHYQPSREYVPVKEKETEVKDEREEVEEDTRPISPLLIEKPIHSVDLVDIPMTGLGEAIRNIVARGILKGTGENKFEPETTISRAMITELFMRLSIEKSIDKDVKFLDINFDDWYYDSVRWAAAMNIVKGYEDGSFKPNQKVTLQEFAVMLHRMLKEFGVELPKIKEVDEKDYSYLLDWCKCEVIDLVEAGFIEVDQYGEHAYDGEVSREYFAVVIDRLIKFMEANYNTEKVHK